MKILKYILFFFLGLFLILTLIGVFNSNIQYGHTIRVNKSIEESWQIFNDHSKYDQWLTGFKSIELQSGAPMTVGSTYRVVVKPEEDAPDFVMLETITSIKEHDHVSLNFDSDAMIFDQTTSFKEENGQTVISTDSKVKAKGFGGRIMFGVMDALMNAFQVQEEKNIEALKKVIEEN